MTAFRLSAFYAAYFLVVGVHLPFWPLWLADQGLSTADIGLILGLGVGVKVIGNPLVAQVADRRGDRKPLMVVLILAALAAMAAFALADGFWPILLVNLLFFAVWPAVMPLAESLALRAAQEGATQYGRVRLWGSITFILTSVAGGRLLVDASADRIYWMVLAGLAVTLAACLVLPDRRQAGLTAGRWALGPLLRDRRFVLFLATCAAVQGSHGLYYGFATLHWRAVGFGEDLIGALWAEGVIAEIALFAVGGWVLRRVGAMRLLYLSGLAAAVRWGATGLTDSLWVLVPMQALHAFTYGGAHLAAIHHMGTTVPATLSASAQALYSAAVMGIGVGLALYVSGDLYAALGGGAFHAMAVMGAVGALLGWRLARRSATESP
ncbi:MAG: MFS transporter [Rhodobacterales bacterium]|nr:MFS transporter [Rhodobacterales bacterium]